MTEDLEALCRERLNGAGVPWSASNNWSPSDGWAQSGHPVDSEAWSCRQAVKVRNRVGSGGNGGIPLWAELKSFVGAVIDRNGIRVESFAAHTRANTDFDHNRLLEVLNYDLSTYSIEELAGEQDGDEAQSTVDGSTDKPRDWFGLVNPFDVDCAIEDLTGQQTELVDVRQIVDHTIGLDGGNPDSLMTNLGVRTRAMELAAADILMAIQRVSPRSMYAAVSKPSPIWLGLEGSPRKHYWRQLPPPSGPKIGILTGNGPDSGRALWGDLLEALRKAYQFVPDVFMPAVMINSVPEMGLSMELVRREAEVERAVLRGVADLLNAGCRLVTIACNTTIYFADQINEACEARKAQFVSIAEASVRGLESAKENTHIVGLVGIGPVIDVEGGFSGYQAPLVAHGLEVVPSDGEQLAYRVKSLGEDDPKLVTLFQRQMRPLPVVVILALTEISMLYRRHIAKASAKRPDPHIYIDPLAELGQELAYRYLVHGYLESEVCQIVDRAYLEHHVRQLLGWIPNSEMPQN